ncbi:MAG: pilus assembly PilX N-terminal domain-containing protein [Candidatus Omnitrophica bacterium]|nr:pilus assembly PilX N-terminal domain-containing protein [Candidatus Omnitrophota bacterium]
MKENKKGQIALIIVLIMIVVLTIGLALISRSLTDIKISEDEKESLRAFSAAEAGIEEALRNIGAYSGGETTIQVEDTNVTIKVEETGEGTQLTLEHGEVMNILLPDGPPSELNSLKIYWTLLANNEENSNPAAVEIAVYKNDFSFNRFAYNGYGSSRDNNFDEAGSGEEGFRSLANISLSSQVRLVRIRPFYNRATVRVNSNSGNLPVQVYNITSTATYGEEKISRVEVARTVPVLPPIFDYVLFSKGNLSN